MEKLTVGRIVHYVAEAGYQGLDEGNTYPAIVVEAHSDTCATLSVFTKSSLYPLHVIWSATLGDGKTPRTWSWPTRASAPTPTAKTEE